MGRFLSGGSNSSGYGSANLPQLFSTVTAGEAVTQGEIAVVSSDGLAYMGADPSVVANATKPIFNSSPTANTIINQKPILPSHQNATVLANGNSGSASFYGGSSVAGAFLSNGNFVVAWQQVNSPFNVQFAIFNPSGVQQGGIVNVTSLSAISGFMISVVALTGGGFAMGFAQNIAPFAHYAVFDNEGNQVKAVTTVAAGMLSSGVQIKLAALSTGGFVIAYAANGLGTRFTIFDAIGNTSFASGAIIASYFAVDVAAFTAAQGGGFVIAYNDTTNGSYVAKYTNAGGASVGAVHVGGTTNTYVSVCVLTGGGYATAAQNGAVNVCVFNATGQQLSTVLTGASINNTINPKIVALSNGDCAAASIAGVSSSTNTVLAYLSGVTGALLKSVPASTIPFTNNSNVNLSIHANKYGGVSMFAGGGGIAYNYLVAFDASLNMIGILNNMTAAPFNAYGHYGSAPPLLMPSPTNNVTVFMGVPNGGGALSIALLSNYQQRAIPVGVFAANAAKGEQVSIQYSGYVNLAVGFTQPYSVDARSYAGQCMNVVGNSATLYGVQNLSSNRRSIN